MSAWVRGAAAAVALSASLFATGAERYGLGTTPTAEQVAGWDIDIRPDGQGLPAGEGTAIDGEDVYVERCASCHGEFGEAVGRYPVLMGGEGTLASEEPVKTVGSYWPYASTVFDYIRRAMPFGHAQSLSNDEVYGITAYVLSLNDIIDEDHVLNAQTLAAVQMPNRDGFIADNRPAPAGGKPCMTDCRATAKVVGKARVIDVTPDEEAAASAAVSVATNASSAWPGDSANGEKVFAQCSACHSLKADEHLVGPSLHGIAGRASGSADGFERYSDAMKAAGVTWSGESLKSYLASPQEFVVGTNMPFFGVKDETALNDLVAYLLGQSGDQ